MKELFKSRKFRKEQLKLIQDCSEVIDGYMAQGLRLTIRQLFYQLVTKNIMTNDKKSYDRVIYYMGKARLAGMVDWDAIEDRVRIPVIPSEFKSIEELIEVALNSYRLPRWAGQKNYVELWVEKNSLAEILRPMANEYHVPMIVDIGYSSWSAMYEASKRFINLDETIRKIILYLGDFDPSGEDMPRDIEDRMKLLTRGLKVKVIKIAITREQVEKYNLLPNRINIKKKKPDERAKKPDPRQKKFIAKHGPLSYEVDAIKPTELLKIVKKKIKKYIDKPLMDEILKLEEVDKARLRRLAESEL